jgi:tryptophan halogenase
MRIVVVGRGNAGFISALILRQAFPNCPITIIGSEEVPVIGVGEGSQEHLALFLDFCKLERAEILPASLGTLKKGIRFEDWGNQFPDYFHAIVGLTASPDVRSNVFGFQSEYAEYLQREVPICEGLTTKERLFSDEIRAEGSFRSVNQYHFDTYELNDYFTVKAKQRNIEVLNGHVEKVNAKNDTIGSVELKDGSLIHGDFWIDASGFSRVLMSNLSENNWCSYSEYLLTDSAIAFRTSSDESGKIRPYTRARALSSGWAWEIPTQTQRGNGYVYSSQFCSEEEAVSEMEELLDIQISDYKHFKFDPGHLESGWVGNCVAMGLAGSFVEPLEATSIGTTICQTNGLLPYLATYQPENENSRRQYNGDFESLMINILDMIRLHYVSDREDTEFWKAQKVAPLTDNVERMLGLWQERLPDPSDVKMGNRDMHMFHAPNFYVVAQGQGLLNPDLAMRALESFGLSKAVKDVLYRMREQMLSTAYEDHAKKIKEL